MTENQQGDQLSNTASGRPPVLVVPAEEGLTLIDIANTLLRSWRVVIGLPLILCLAVGLWSLTQDPMYAVKASFIPESTDQRSGGTAAALAQQFGVNIGSSRPGESPQFYVDLLRSRSVQRQTVESTYEVETPEGVRSATLIDLLGIEEPEGGLPPWRLAMEELRKNMSTSVARETGVVELTVAAPYPQLAEQIASRMLEILNGFNMDVRQTRAREEVRFVGSRIEEAQADLRAGEDRYNDFLRQNREFSSSPELVFEHDRLYRQVAMLQEVYTSLRRSQEQARIDAVRDTPLFTVIDDPTGAAEPQGRGTVTRSLAAFLIGLLAAVLIAFARESGRKNRAAVSAEYQDLQRLARQAWHDLRHPSRWLGSDKRPVAASDH